MKKTTNQGLSIKSVMLAPWGKKEEITKYTVEENNSITYEVCDFNVVDGAKQYTNCKGFILTPADIVERIALAEKLGRLYIDEADDIGRMCKDLNSKDCRHNYLALRTFRNTTPQINLKDK